MDKHLLLNKTFKDISEITNGRYVTLRNYDLIPEDSSMENDIDILIKPLFIQEIINKVKPYGYKIYQDSNNCLYGAQPHIHFKHSNLNVHFDITTGLYYRSIADNNIFVNIDNRLTKSIIDNRIKVKNIYQNIPHPNDEIVHLICHCIFDKRKTTNRYEKQIINLVDQINPHIIKNTLGLIFYKATDMIFTKVMNKDIKDLFESYITFKDY